MPRFLAELHRLLALGVKVLRKWEGPVWDHERPSVVQLRTPEATWEKLAYAMSNPVAAGLVNWAADWPGVTTLPHELGRAEWKCRRPKVFFDPDNPQWPGEVTLPLTLPECLDAEPEQVREVVAEELARCEAQAHESMRAKGWRALGRRAVRKLSPYKRAGARPETPDRAWRSAALRRKPGDGSEFWNGHE